MLEVGCAASRKPKAREQADEVGVRASEPRAKMGNAGLL